MISLEGLWGFDGIHLIRGYGFVTRPCLTRSSKRCSSSSVQMAAGTASSRCLGIGLPLTSDRPYVPSSIFSSRLLKIATHESQYDQRGKAMEERHARNGCRSRRPLQLRLDGAAGAGDA